MSAYWGYYCQDCQKATDTWTKDEEKLTEYYHLYPLIVIIEHYFKWVEIGILGASADIGEMAGFLSKHKQHRICLRNEYGDLFQIPSLKHLEQAQVQALLLRGK